MYEDRDQQPKNLNWDIFLSEPIYIKSHHLTTPHVTTNAFHVAIMKLTIEDLNLQQIWLLKEAGTNQHTRQKRDGAFLRNYQKTSISQAEDGTYTARFLWKLDHPQLPINFTRRTSSLQARQTESPSQYYLRPSEEGLHRETVATIASPLPPCQIGLCHNPIRVAFDSSCRQGKG